jgi:hypothetical protein
MSKRTERRAAERAARQAERQRQPQSPVAEANKALAATASADYFEFDENCVFPGETPGERQRADRAAINRANAERSTGPKSPEGRAISSSNALKHGLTGNTVLLDSDDADAYQERLDAYVKQFKPVTLEERRLVQSIHDAAWRLDRIINLESAVYAKGRIELFGCYYELPEDQRKTFIELEIFHRNTKTLRNFEIQEARIQRQRAKDIAALNLLIEKRLAEQQTEPPAQSESKTQPKPTPPVGFEFSNPENSSQTPRSNAPDSRDQARETGKKETPGPFA